MNYLTTFKQGALLLAASLTLYMAMGCMGSSQDNLSGDSYADSDADMDVDGDTDGDSDGDSTIIEDPEEWDTDTEVDPCDTVNEVVLYLSADDSNSMASPVEARSVILSGARYMNSVRTYEFLNYYTFDNAPALAGAVAVTAQMTPNDEVGEGVVLAVVKHTTDIRDVHAR